MLYVDVNEAGLDPRDRDIISVTNTLVLVSIDDDDRMLFFSVSYVMTC